MRIRQPEAGELVADRSKIERPLWGGGMGVVYLAERPDEVAGVQQMGVLLARKGASSDG